MEGGSSAVFTLFTFAALPITTAAWICSSAAAATAPSARSFWPMARAASGRPAFTYASSSAVQAAPSRQRGSSTPFLAFSSAFAHRRTARREFATATAGPVLRSRPHAETMRVTTAEVGLWPCASISRSAASARGPWHLLAAQTCSSARHVPSSVMCRLCAFLISSSLGFGAPSAAMGVANVFGKSTRRA